MNESVKEKLDFIAEYYKKLSLLHYSYRFAVLEYIFSDIDRLTNDNKKHILSRCNFFVEKPFGENLPIHKSLPSDVSYENIKSMLMEYKKYLEDVLKLNIYNKDKLNKIRSIVCSILNECYKLSDIIVENTDINRRKK